MFLAILIITAAVLSSLFRALTPWAKQYKSEVEHHLSSLLGEPVSIGTMETGWYWFEPVIKLNHVTITNSNKPSLNLNKLLVGINIFSSIWHWHLQPGILFIDDLSLHVRQVDDGWQIEGLEGLDMHQVNTGLASYKPLLVWILAQQKIIIKNFSLQVFLKDGTIIPLRNLNLVVNNRGGLFRIKGKGSLAQVIPTKLELLGRLKVDPDAMDHLSGSVYLSLQKFLPAQWASFFPNSTIQLKDGKGGLKLWVDLKKGHFKSIQSSFHFKQLEWQDNQTNKTRRIDAIKANLSWKPNKDGWNLSADKIHLRYGNISWPTNSLVLSYSQPNQRYFAYVHRIMIKPLLDADLDWPKSLSPVLDYQPQGDLYDTQLVFAQGQMTSLLSRFEGLSWQGNKAVPGFSQLSGVINWQPDEGRLALDASHAELTIKDKPPIALTEFNSVINWKTKADGLRLTLERFILKAPNLAMEAHGGLSGRTADKPGDLSLVARVSATQAQHWMTYIPSGHLKPKLEAWLKHDIKRIAQLNSQLFINGSLADFPFDNNKGEFTIKTWLKGVDLRFAHDWPLVKAIEAELRIDKRLLEADIVHADFNNIILKAGNLNIKNLGLNHESLLVHTRAHDEAAKFLSYIQASPLKKKLASLNKLKISGPVDVDFGIEAPLYPENDDILARGQVEFKNNQVLVAHDSSNITINQLNGTLKFNQDGVLFSPFNAMLIGFPLQFSMESIHKPDSFVEVKLLAQTSIAELKNQFKLNLFNVMDGPLVLEGLLKLRERPGKFDELNIRSKLNNLSIELPAPFGKKRGVNSELKLAMRFQSEKNSYLHVNYANELDSNLLFKTSQGKLQLEGGQIQIEKGVPTKPAGKGLEVNGHIKQFELSQWMNVKDKLAQGSDNSLLMDKLKQVNLNLDSAQFGERFYTHLSIKASKQDVNSWAFHLAQKDFNAHLNYNLKTNTLGGEFDRLYLPVDFSKKEQLSASTLHPSDLPNIDLSIRSLDVGKLALGELTIKGHTAATTWTLDALKLESPSYQLNARGNWKQKNKINATRIKADMRINNLSKTLTRWNISPVVEAKRGDILFEGGWPRPLHDFNLSKVNGQFFMRFTKGRITNLSRETEEKLGLGKLLSILSLQTIPRRLQLDFSDLAKGGYSFDEFQGRFNLDNGIMSTSDSFVDGPVAHASMKGHLDLVKQNYNVDLKISPHITASLPIVATIAGGPIAGMATWIASKIINQGMEKISGYTYKVSGPWREPLVEQVKIIKERNYSAPAPKKPFLAWLRRKAG